jgi:hypothetical protein
VPFVKTRCRNQHPPVPHGGAERSFLVAAVSERALISSGKSAGSLTQPGSKPQRASSARRSGAVVALLAAAVARTIRIGCVGAML